MPRHFFVPALGAALLNVVMIAMFCLLLGHGPKLEERIFGLAIESCWPGWPGTFQLPAWLGKVTAIIGFALARSTVRENCFAKCCPDHRRGRISNQMFWSTQSFASGSAIALWQL